MTCYLTYVCLCVCLYSFMCTLKPKYTHVMSMLNLCAVLKNNIIKWLNKIRNMWQNEHYLYYFCTEQYCLLSMHVDICYKVCYAWLCEWLYEYRVLCCEMFINVFYLNVLFICDHSCHVIFKEFAFTADWDNQAELL